MEAIVAIAASALSAVQLIPQTIAAVKDRDVSHLSRGSFLMLTVSSFLWILHGSNIRDTAVIFANLIMFSCSAIILFATFKQKGLGGKKRAPQIRRRR